MRALTWGGRKLGAPTWGRGEPGGPDLGGVPSKRPGETQDARDRGTAAGQGSAVRDFLGDEITRMPGVFERLERTFTHRDESGVELVISAWEAKQTASQRTIINSWENKIAVQRRKVTTLAWLNCEWPLRGCIIFKDGGIGGSGQNRALGLQRKHWSGLRL